MKPLYLHILSNAEDFFGCCSSWYFCYNRGCCYKNNSYRMKCSLFKKIGHEDARWIDILETKIPDKIINKYARRLVE